MSTPLDDLMQADPLSLTKENIDSLIAHYRRQREGGPKPKRESGAAERKIDLAEIGLAAPKQAFVRRV